MMHPAIQAYIAAAPESRRERLSALHALIMRLYPDAQQELSWNMPSYRWRHGWVALANFKHHVGLYTCAAEHLEAFKAQQPQIKTGKGCINLRDKDTLPLDDLEQVVHSAMNTPAKHG